MARIWSSGFELNTNTANVEWTNSNGTPSIITTIVRSGTYAGQSASLASGTPKGWQYQYLAAATAANSLYIRFYIYITAYPSADNCVMKLANTTTFNTSTSGHIKLTSTGTLKLFNFGGTLIGSASSALSLNRWYMVEFHTDGTPASGSQVLEARVDGIVFATSSAQSLPTNEILYIGANMLAETQTTGGWIFDDIAINDNTGSFQTSYPGSGKIIHLRPNAVGDVNTFTKSGTSPQATNWQGVKEVTPDDGTTLNNSKTLNQEDLFNIDDPLTIADNDTISLVAVGGRFNALSASGSGFKFEIEASASGTIEQSAAITPTTTTWITNALVAPRNYPMTLYDMPGASTTAITKADLTTTQVGYKITTAGTFQTQISTVWLLVEYVPAQAYLANLTTATAAAASSKTFAHVTDAGATNTLLIVGISAFDATLANRTVSSVTYNSVSMTPITAQDNAGEPGQAALFWLIAPATGSNNVVVTMGGVCSNVNIYAATFAGIMQSGQPDITGGQAVSTVTSSTVSVTTTAANDIVVDALIGGTGPMTATNGEGILMDLSGSTGMGRWKFASAAGSTSMGYTTGANDDYAHTVGAFKQFSNTVVVTFFDHTITISQPIIDIGLTQV